MLSNVSVDSYTSISIMDERDLHIKVISYIRNNHPNAILCAGLGELQNSSTKRIEAYKKGYTGKNNLTLHFK